MIKFGSPRILATAALVLSAVSRVCEARHADGDTSLDVHLDAPEHEHEHGHVGKASLHDVHADEEHKVLDHDIFHDARAIVTLGPDAVLKSLEERGIVVVEFFAPWCYHCTKSADDLDKAAARLASQDIKVYKVNCDEAANKSYCERMGIEGFPTLKVAINVSGITLFKDYKKAITEEGVVDFVNQYANFAPEIFSGHADFSKLPPTTIPVVFLANGVDLMPIAKFAAAHLDGSIQMEHISIGTMNADEMPDGLKHIKESHLLVYRGGINLPPVSYTGKLDIEHMNEIVGFISVASVPVVAKFDQKDTSRYGLPNSRLVYGLYATEEQNDKLIALFNDAYSKRPNTWAARTFPMEDYQVIMDFFSFNPKECKGPYIAVRCVSEALNYRYEGADDVDELLKFEDDIAHRRIETFVRNEKDVPESTGQVKRVNAQTLRDLLGNNPESTSFMVVFTHPSYPDMENGVTVLEEVAKKFSDHQHLRFLTMDLSKNDVHPDITDKFSSDLMHINLFVEGKEFKPMTSMDVTEYHICELLAEHLKLTNPFPKPVIDHKAKIQEMMNDTSVYDDDLMSMSKDLDAEAAEDPAAVETKDQSSTHGEEDDVL